MALAGFQLLLKMKLKTPWWRKTSVDCPIRRMKKYASQRQDGEGQPGQAIAHDLIGQAACR